MVRIVFSGKNLLSIPRSASMVTSRSVTSTFPLTAFLKRPICAARENVITEPFQVFVEFEIVSGGINGKFEKDAAGQLPFEKSMLEHSFCC
jgi:hypothetical protein